MWKAADIPFLSMRKASRQKCIRPKEVLPLYLHDHYNIFFLSPAPFEVRPHLFFVFFAVLDDSPSFLFINIEDKTFVPVSRKNHQFSMGPTPHFDVPGVVTFLTRFILPQGSWNLLIYQHISTLQQCKRTPPCIIITRHSYKSTWWVRNNLQIP